MRVFGPSKLGNALIVIGLLLLLYVPISYGWTDLQGMILRSQLSSELPSGGGAVPADDGLHATASPSSTAVAALNPVLPSLDTATATSEPATPAPTKPPTLPSQVLGARSVEPGATPQTALAAPPSPSATLPPTPTRVPTATPTPLPPTSLSSMPAPLGPPARVAFPDLHIDAKVTTMDWKEVQQPDGTQSSEWQVPDYTVGWAVNSGELGAPGNVVLSGHNNIFNMVFRNISLAWSENAKRQVNPSVYSSDLLNGRLIELYSGDGKRFDYRVTGFYRLHDSGVTLEQRQQNADYMQPTSDPELTLITCWPPWSNTYRLVVRAKLVQ